MSLDVILKYDLYVIEFDIILTAGAAADVVEALECREKRHILAPRQRADQVHAEREVVCLHRHGVKVLVVYVIAVVVLRGLPPYHDPAFFVGAWQPWHT